ncbi:hypothetical protein C8J57DRAFT_1725736 [Mycena rebaudengoi]|nr:hypothetical protein C8J57DRAFT_1725736 [Mycena rebaudengoi]
MPQLRKLQLSYVRLPFSSLRGLESLDLARCIDTTTSTLPTLDTLLAVLEASPQLHTLVFYVPGVEGISHSVKLPNLRCNIFVHLYTMGVPDGEDVRSILVPVHKRLRSLPLHPPSLVRISCAEDHIKCRWFSHLTTTLHRDEITSKPPEEGDDNAFFIIDLHPGSHLALRRSMSKVLKAMPFESITHLDAWYAQDLTVASWKTVFMCLPALQKIYMGSNIIARTIFDTLIELESHRTRLGAPRLRYITLYAVWEKDRNERASMWKMVHALIRYVRLLHGNGASLQVLDIDESKSTVTSVPQGAWDEMHSIVRKVIRNGTVFSDASGH